MEEDKIDKLLKLNELREKGVLTQDEFNEQKKNLLTTEKSSELKNDQHQFTEEFREKIIDINDQQINSNRNMLKILIFVCMLGLIGYLISTNPGKVLAKELIVGKYADPAGQVIKIDNIRCLNILVMTNCVSTWSDGGRPGVFAVILNEAHNSYFTIFFIFLILYLVFSIPYQFSKRIFLKKAEIQNLQSVESEVANAASVLLDKLNTPRGLAIVFVLTMIILFIFD
jgi:hypothetical protein